jgi:hypothetical protein
VGWAGNSCGSTRAEHLRAVPRLVGVHKARQNPELWDAGWLVRGGLLLKHQLSADLMRATIRMARLAELVTAARWQQLVGPWTIFQFVNFAWLRFPLRTW